MNTETKSIVEWGFDSTNQRWYISCIEVTYDGEEETHRETVKQRYSKDIASGSINGHTVNKAVKAKDPVWNTHWNYNEEGARTYALQFTHKTPDNVIRKDID